MSDLYLTKRRVRILTANNYDQLEAKINDSLDTLSSRKNLEIIDIKLAPVPNLNTAVRAMIIYKFDEKYDQFADHDLDPNSRPLYVR